jgi:hypothetical protein
VSLLEESLKEYDKLDDLNDMNTFLQGMSASLYAPTQPGNESFVSAFDLTSKDQAIWNVSEGGKFKKSRIQNRKQTMRSKKNQINNIMKKSRNIQTLRNNIMKKSRNIQTLRNNIMKKSRNIQTHSNVMKKSRNVKKQY